MSTAYGKPTTENMPFDLAHLRFPITYNCPEDADDEVRKREKQELTGKLESALKAYFHSDVFRRSLPGPPTPPPFVPRVPAMDKADSGRRDNPSAYRMTRSPFQATPKCRLRTLRPRGFV